MVSLPINQESAVLFSDRVKEKFSNYSDASGYQSPGQRGPYIRGPGVDSVLMDLRGNNSKQEITIYTFDKSDSCIIYSGFLSDSVYRINFTQIPIPSGRYLVKLFGIIDTLDRP
jgi:hypothetical protein